ncbi:tetratricopeptide repeat protein [Micromonospora sp. HUAS LYJ1]|uniref:tetratricopeptide repeat protein n=1 Tax=Micromonospora sp. HUAS LYJ1 TaxID=3061626 RepID=UPI00349FED7C
MVATGQLIDEDPAEALAHAMAARRLAARISAVREAVGLAAYHAGEWQTAIAELRTYHRMTGLQSHLAVLADCERALGRPERAIDLFRGADSDKLDKAVAVELLIVAAGARGDLGQKDAAVAMLQVPELTTDVAEPWTARLRYAFADALLAVDRREEAREWFSRAADVDADGETDAPERLLELDGVVIEGDDEDDEPDEESAAAGEATGTLPADPDAGARRTADDRDEDDDVDDEARDSHDDRDEVRDGAGDDTGAAPSRPDAAEAGGDAADADQDVRDANRDDRAGDDLPAGTARDTDDVAGAAADDRPGTVASPTAGADEVTAPGGARPIGDAAAEADQR